MFSKACEYAIRASIYIVQQSQHNRRVSLKDVAKAIESPEAYTSKVLQQLCQNHIINSDKGPTGGFSMDSRQQEEVRLSTIVSAIDGDNIYTGCGLGLKNCNARRPCPLHDKFMDIRNGLREMLEGTTIKSLSMDLGTGLTFLRR